MILFALCATNTFWKATYTTSKYSGSILFPFRVDPFFNSDRYASLNNIAISFYLTLLYPNKKYASLNIKWASSKEPVCLRHLVWLKTHQMYQMLLRPNPNLTTIHEYMLQSFLLITHIVLQCEQTYFLTCASNEDLNQPVHPRSLIRAVFVCIKKPSRKHAYIVLAPLIYQFYIVKLGFNWVYIIYLISAQS